MKQQQRTIISLTHKYVLWRITEIEDLLSIQTRGIFKKRIYQMINESTMGHYCRIIIKQG